MNDINARILNNLIGRLHGPMQFRLILQPTMATIYAIYGGWKDAKTGRPAYFWSILTNPESRRELIHEGWKAIRNVFILAIAMDAVYQWRVLPKFYPAEALIVAMGLAVLPYVLIRGPVNHLVRLFMRSHT